MGLGVGLSRAGHEGKWGSQCGKNLDTEIARALDAARECERKSDDCFAAGDVLNGAKYFRWAILSYRCADDAAELSERASVNKQNLWWD